MAKKLEDIHPVSVHAGEDAKGRIQVRLSQPIVQKKRLMRWLHHRVIDLLADYGLLDFLDKDLEDRLSLLCADITSDYVSEMLKEGEKAVKQQDDEAGETAQDDEADA